MGGLLSEITNSLLLIFWEALSFLTSPGKRLFFGALLSSALLAVVYAIWARGLRGQALWQFLFPPQLRQWRTHVIDFQFFISNIAIKSLLILPFLASQVTLVIMTTSFLESILGESPVFSLSYLQVSVLFTLTLFVVEDASRYLLHRCFHENAWLCSCHKVHHSAEVMTPLTLHRVHPIEMALGTLRHFFVIGVVTGCFFYCFRLRLSGLEILGVDALGFLFNHLGANLRHSHIPLSFGGLESWFISPAQHQIHHSAAPEHRNRNFGTCFAIWDRLGKTLVLSKEQRLSFGLGAHDNSCSPRYTNMMLLPFVDLWKHIKF